MKKLLFIIFLLSSVALFAQSSGQHEPPVAERVEMADAFRAEGKIYVVVAIVGIVLAGLIVYTIRIDRKIAKLEDEVNQKSERNPVKAG